MFNLYLLWLVLVCQSSKQSSYVPAVVDGLYYETKRWTDAVDIFIHDLLHDSRLSCIVQAPCMQSACRGCE